jgi:nitronate monooxygenase
MAAASTPQLAAAVTNAGGLGSLGCAAMPPEQVRKDVEAVRALTDGPFNLNFFVHDEPTLDAESIEKARTRIEPYYTESGLDDVPEVSVPFPSFNEAKLEVLLELRPPVISFHFGLPEPEAVTALKAAGAVILSSATTVAEARSLAEAGADAIVAQGQEAGGHRGTFAEPFDDGMVGTIALVPQVVDAVDVPVIAAGGIADGRGVAAAFDLGASGVQIGTAYLLCPESAADDTYRAALRDGRDDLTRVTRAISGRPARSLRNRLIDEMADHQDEVAPFPSQMSLTAPLRNAYRNDPSQLRSLWSGQAVGLNREVSASDLTLALVDEARRILER